MKKINTIVVVSLYLWSMSLIAVEPNDGGIGGTGRDTGPVEVDVFERPEVDIIDIPLPTDVLEGVPDFSEMTDGVPDDLESTFPDLLDAIETQP